MYEPRLEVSNNVVCATSKAYHTVLGYSISLAETCARVLYPIIKCIVRYFSGGCDIIFRIRVSGLLKLLNLIGRLVKIDPKLLFCMELFVLL